VITHLETTDYGVLRKYSLNPVGFRMMPCLGWFWIDDAFSASNALTRRLSEVTCLLCLAEAQ
jgi:hypothetical protein